MGIFARAPILGRTKTRLIPLLGPDGAARFHECAILDTVERITALGFAARFFLAPPSAGPRIRRLGVSIPIRGQSRGNLGKRMAEALSGLLRIRGADRAFLVGTDSPDLPVEILVGAARSLRRAPVVLAPAHDGGFTLIGARRGAVPADGLARILTGVLWSAPDTLARTAERFAGAGVKPTLLPVWWDVDEPRDLLALAARMAASRARGPAVPARVAAYLREWEAARPSGRPQRRGGRPAVRESP